MTLTYKPRLAKVKVDPHAKNQGQTVQTGERQQTNEHAHTHTHGCYETYYLPCYAVDKDTCLWAERATDRDAGDGEHLQDELTTTC